MIGTGSQRLILEIVWGQEKAQTLDPLVRKAAESVGYCKLIRRSRAVVQLGMSPTVCQTLPDPVTPYGVHGGSPE